MSGDAAFCTRGAKWLASEKKKKKKTNKNAIYLWMWSTRHCSNNVYSRGFYANKFYLMSRGQISGLS